MEKQIIILNESNKIETELSKIDFTTDNKHVEFSFENNDEKLLESINKVLDKEVELFLDETTCHNEISLNIKKLPKDVKIKVLEDILKREDIIDSNIILNIYNFIKGYNTFDDTFFESSIIFVNDLEEFLDIKYELKDLFNNLIKQLVIYYLSILKSCDKITVEEDMIKVPFLYQRIFFITDFSTLATLLNKIKDISLDSLYSINNANAYLNSLSLNQIIKKQVVSIIEE